MKPRVTDSVERSRRPLPWRVLTGALFLVAMGLLLALGTWQVQRLAWKEALLERIETGLSQPPASVAEIERLVNAGEPVEYRPMRATGSFLHELERHFFATHQGQSGFYVYTPLRLEDGRALFVNRGFVPYDRKDARNRPDGQVGGTVTVTGLAREELKQKPSWIVPDNEPSNNIFYWKDRAAMAESAGLEAGVLPFFLDADDSPNPGGVPVGGVTIINLPNNHLQYAITWYGLALALAGVGVVAYLRGRKANRLEP